MIEMNEEKAKMIVLRDGHKISIGEPTNLFVYGEAQGFLAGLAAGREEERVLSDRLAEAADALCEEHEQGQFEMNPPTDKLFEKLKDMLKDYRASRGKE